MYDTILCNGWCCTDCIILLANGDAPTDMSEEMPRDDLGRFISPGMSELAAYLHTVESYAGGSITIGMLREEHSCLDENGQTAGDLGGECECETKTFSWSPCDVCGGNLGGSRHAVTFWTDKYDSNKSLDPVAIGRQENMVPDLDSYLLNEV